MARPVDLIVAEMLDHIEPARSFTEGMTLDQYGADRKTQRAVERCIEVISEASRHLPPEIKTAYPQIPWSDVAGIGNIFRHEYHHIAARIVWDTVALSLPALENVLERIAAELPPK